VVDVQFFVCTAVSYDCNTMCIKDTHSHRKIQRFMFFITSNEYRNWCARRAVTNVNVLRTESLLRDAVASTMESASDLVGLCAAFVKPLSLADSDLWNFADEPLAGSPTFTSTFSNSSPLNATAFISTHIHRIRILAMLPVIIQSFQNWLCTRTWKTIYAHVRTASA
jgi:hypothetical protein